MSVPDLHAIPRAYAREWWRWHFAGQIATAYVAVAMGSNQVPTDTAVAEWSVQQAEALIAELERER